TLPLQEHDREIVLRTAVAVLGGAMVPLDRFLEIADHALAGAVHRCQLELRAGITLLGGHAEPQRRGRRVLGHGAALQVVPREEALGVKVTCGGGLTIATLGRNKIGLSALTLGIKMTELNERGGMARFRGLAEQLKRPSKIL